MSADRKTAVVTGSTGGLGHELCRRLASQGWDLVLVNRSREKANAQLESLFECAPDRKVDSHLADVMNPDEIAEATQSIAAENTRLAALYNVAGLLTDRPTQSREGIEGHFAINTLAPYLFTQGLRLSLANGATNDRPSVVVNFSSSAIKGVKQLDVGGLTDPSNPGGLLGAYAKTKMALTVATALMADDLAQEGILAICVDPGATKTPMTNGGDGMPWFVRLLVPLLFKSAPAQAEKILNGVALAIEKGEPGALIVEGKLRPMPALAADEPTRTSLKALLDGLASPHS